MKKFVVVVLALSFIIGCTPIERTAYNTVIASKAFLDSIKAKHPECAAPINRTRLLCSSLTRATAAKDLIIDAGKAYCQVDQFANTSDIPCSPIPKGTPAADQALQALKSALAGYDQAEKDLKGLL